MKLNADDFFLSTLWDGHLNLVPDEVKESAKYRILDFLGVVRAGAQLLSESGRGRGQVGFLSRSSAQIWLNPGLSSPEEAAFWNAWSAHATELDDGDRFGAVHPGAVVIPAVLAVVQDEDLSTQDMVRGIHVGYLATLWLARSLQPHLRDSGYHASGTCGVMGAALGVASARRASYAEFRSTFYFALGSSSGRLELFAGSSQMKPFNAAHASFTGLRSAGLGRLGFEGPPSMLSGQNGFLSQMSGGNVVDTLAEPAVSPLGEVYTKPYASCRHCHGPVEAALWLRQRLRHQLHNVSLIRVTTHERAKSRHDHSEVLGEHSAKQSIPYCTSIALLEGLTGLEAFNEASIKTERVLQLARATEVFTTPELTALAPTKRVAVVEVELKDGTVETCRVDYPKGEPENPLSRSEMVEKYLALSAFGGVSKENAMSDLRRLLNEDRPHMFFLRRR